MPAIVVFTLDERRFALPLERVERAVRVVEVTSLPKAPAIVVGVINVEGRIVPVINLRRRFGVPEREIELSDQLLIAASARWRLAMIVDAVDRVVQCSERDLVASDAVVPGAEYVKGIAKLAEGIVLIHDLDTFLSFDEAQTLAQALAGEETPT